MNEKNYTFNTKLLLIFLCLISLNACIKYDTIETDGWQPEIAFPLINTSLGITDFFENTTTDFLEVDANNFLTIVYRNKVSSPPANEIIEVEDFGFIIPDSVIGLSPEFFPFENTINQLDVKSGNLEFNISTAITEDIELSVMFINITRDGQIFRHNAMIEYNGTSPTNITGSLDLSGYSINFEDYFVIAYTAYDINGNRYVLEGMNYNFTDLTFSYIEGDFGGAVVDLPQSSFLLDVIDRAVHGEFMLEDPKVLIEVENSLGVPIELSAFELNGVEDDGTVIPLNSPLDSGVLIKSPPIDSLGNSETILVTIDRNNSNIREVVNAFPNKLQYRFTGEILSTLPDSASYALDASNLDVNLGIELPLWGKVRNMVYESVSDLDPTDLMEAENIEFKLIAENGFPLEANFQVYFQNAQGIAVDSLVDASAPIFIAAGTVDANGLVTSSTTSEISIMLSGAKIASFTDVSQVTVRATLATSNNGSSSVRFFEDYLMNLKLGLRAIIE